MLTERSGAILKSIVGQYIREALPVPSQRVVADANLGVSSATIRHEMSRLEQEGYIHRAHPSAGSVPSDKGYRYYVESLQDVMLSPSEQRLMSHLFHQVERELEKWLSLAATLLARQVKNVAVVTMPKSTDCRLKHLELVALQDGLVLVVLVLNGAKLKQRLVIFDTPLSQTELTAITNRFNHVYGGMSRRKIQAKDIILSPVEKQLTDYLVEMMRAEDEQEYEEPYLDGLHFMLNQPEFTRNQKLLGLMELVEHRRLLKMISPAGLSSRGVRVIIGGENKEASFRDYSVVVSRYGLPREAEGTIGVVGPTRMSYAHTISTVVYLSSLLSGLVAGLYGKELKPEEGQTGTS